MTVKQRVVALLKELCLIKGVSGYEQAVVTRLRDLFVERADSVSVDNFGNVVALKKGVAPGPKIMLVAHADEVGGVVNEILANGFLRFRKMGLVNDAVLPATKVWVGEVPGVIGAKPGHLVSPAEQGRITSVEQLHIDIGAASAEEARSIGVEIGTPVSFAGEVSELGSSDRLCGRAIDNRVGCVALLELMEGIKDLPVVGDIYAVISVREETNMSGAAMVASSLVPDLAIAIDTVPADDTGQGKSKFALGKGPVIQLVEGIQSAYVGTVIHPGVKKSLLEAARTAGIQVQLAAEVGSWTTDAASVHNRGAGIPTGFVSIPRRYAHSPGEVVDVNDLIGAIRILHEFTKASVGIKLNFID